MNILNKLVRRSWLLLFAAVIIGGGMAVLGTLAIITDHTSPLVNTFRPDDAAQAVSTVDVHVVKTMRNLGNRSMLPEGFEFTLTNVTTGETAAATTGANGRAVFRLSFDMDDVGTHRYRLCETAGAIPGVTYSALEYEVRVEVTLTDTLKTAAYLNGEYKDVVEARFENLYDSFVIPATGDTSSLIGCCLALLAGVAGLVWMVRRGKGQKA